MVMEDIPNVIQLFDNSVFLDTLLIVGWEKIFTFILSFSFSIFYAMNISRYKKILRGTLIH